MAYVLHPASSSAGLLGLLGRACAYVLPSICHLGSWAELRTSCPPLCNGLVLVHATSAWVWGVGVGLHKGVLAIRGCEWVGVLKSTYLQPQIACIGRRAGTHMRTHTHAHVHVSAWTRLGVGAPSACCAFKCREVVFAGSCLSISGFPVDSKLTKPQLIMVTIDQRRMSYWSCPPRASQLAACCPQLILVPHY